MQNISSHTHLVSSEKSCSGATALKITAINNHIPKNFHYNKQHFHPKLLSLDSNQPYFTWTTPIKAPWEGGLWKWTKNAISIHPSRSTNFGRSLLVPFFCWNSEKLNSTEPHTPKTYIETKVSAAGGKKKKTKSNFPLISPTFVITVRQSLLSNEFHRKTMTTCDAQL